MINAALAASALILPLFHEGCASHIKADGSIVTLADTQAEALITGTLHAAFPAIPMLGEESTAEGAKPDLGSAYFCVDPIDGTKQFAKGDPQWVIAIAYIEQGRPLAGVILAPAVSGRLFAGLADFGGYEILGDGSRKAFSKLEPNAAPWRILRGYHDTEDSVRQHLPNGQDTIMTALSSAYKFGLIAAGEADVFIRAGRVWDWDIAAGQALIEASGGRVLDLNGQALVYGQAETEYRHPPFIAHNASIKMLGS
jgi:3'(2'), 5'-bisphosphate nucleotidase